MYLSTKMVEKPTPERAERELRTPGLRSGEYLCFFGMHVFTPVVMDILAQQMRVNPETASVSSTLNTLAAEQRYLGWQVSAHRYDLGPRYGLLDAQLALALTGRDRDEVLASLVRLLAAHQGNKEQSDGAVE